MGEKDQASVMPRIQVTNKLHGGELELGELILHASLQTINQPALTTLQWAMDHSHSPHNALHSPIIISGCMSYV